MRKKIYTYIISLLIIILLVPCFAGAKLIAISERDMDSIIGQAGIQIAFNNAGIKMSAETLYYGDEDGIDGGGPAYLSLCDVNMDAEIHSSTPLRIDVGIVDNPFNPGQKIESVMMQISDLTLDIHNFSIGAIRVGSAVGEGKSFGSFGIKNMDIEVTGNIMRWAH